MMERLVISLTGCVQGVGFRPFVFRLANKYRLAGTICNTSSGVKIDVQGVELQRFQKDLIEQKPERAEIFSLVAKPAPLHAARRFEIKTSQSENDTALPLMPDTAICSACLKELFDPTNRRYRYPFLHCIACGPRFSLFLAMPFDRANTSMRAFTQCEECQKEYDDPDDRRFFSQTNCCPQCGPKLSLLNAQGDPIETALHFLQEGKIVALKNTGGYQLWVDATNEEAVQRLRRLKRRAKKPFALLMPSLADIRAIAEVCPTAEEVLTSPAAPILLLLKSEGNIAPSVACGSPCFGVMLPHTPLQHLLLHRFQKPVVATSGNVSQNPLCITEEEALAQLSPVADIILAHNRPISHRLDDSVVHLIAGQPVILRRARGYTPFAISFPIDSPDLFAAGAQQKNTFAFKKKNQIYLSQHIGDLEAPKTLRAFAEEVAQWEKLLSFKAEEGVGDPHPGFFSHQYLERKKIPSTSIQHHKAHVMAGMIDRNLKPPFFSIAWDGTGFGEDGTIWGGEAFTVDEGIHRVASLLPFRLPGGEKAVREPRRSALGLLYALKRPLSGSFSNEELSLLQQALDKGINAPLTSSIGRLFDGVSALLGLCPISDYEGEAAILLEALAWQAQEKKTLYRIDLIHNPLTLLDFRPMIAKLLEEHHPLAEKAWAFHEALAHSIVELARRAAHSNVLLTGGVMQNKLLVELAVEKLRQAGFTPHWHSRIPPNDGGLSVGQIVGNLYRR